MVSVTWGGRGLASKKMDGRTAERCHGLRRGRGENDEGEALMANAITTAAGVQGGMIRSDQNGWGNSLSEEQGEPWRMMDGYREGDKGRKR